MRHGFSVGSAGSFPTSNIKNAKDGIGLGTMLGIVASSIGALFGFILLLIFGAQLGGNAALFGNLPASNITKITTNVGNGVVAGSGFVVLIFIGAAAALTLGIVGLIIFALRAIRG